MSNDEKFEKKLDRIAEDVAKINITLVGQHHTLKEHMRHSTLNEEAINIIKEELVPIQNHVNGLNYVLKVCGVLALVITLISGIVKFKDLF